MVRTVALDGPAGSGKSTVARGMAARLGLPYLDTGAMYRAVTWAVLAAGAEPADAEAATTIARAMQLEVADGNVKVDGHDVTTAIRGADVTAAVSAVSSHPDVRAELVQRQRDWVRNQGGGVLEGRDIGTVVLPDADLKVFLTASARVRAERRAAETDEDVDIVEQAIQRRDEFDSNREHSPLVRAIGAIDFDTSELDVPQVIDALVTVASHLS